LKEERRNNSGFTLLEIVITVFLASIVLVLGFTSLYLSSSSSTDRRLSLYKEREQAKIFSMIRNQLLSLYSSSRRNASLEGLKGIEERNDELHFFTASPLYNNGIVEAGYSIVANEDGNKYLAYREFPYVSKDKFQEGKWTKISGIIDGMTIEYEESGMRFREWKNTELPEKIRITLYSKDDYFSFSVVPGIKSNFW